MRTYPAVLTATATSPTSSREHDPEPMHQLMAATLDTIIAEIKAIQEMRVRVDPRLDLSGR